MCIFTNMANVTLVSILLRIRPKTSFNMQLFHDLCVTYIYAQRTQQPFSGLIKTQKKLVQSHLFNPTFCPCLSFSESQCILSLLMACDRSHLLSTRATHLLLLTIWWGAKTVICYSLLTNRWCLLFAAALKTITVSLRFSCDCIAYFLAKLHWWWNWKRDLLFTVNERNWKMFQIIWSPTSQVTHHLISRQNRMFT